MARDPLGETFGQGADLGQLRHTRKVRSRRPSAAPRFGAPPSRLARLGSAGSPGTGSGGAGGDRLGGGPPLPLGHPRGLLPPAAAHAGARGGGRTRPPRRAAPQTNPRDRPAPPSPPE